MNETFLFSKPINKSMLKRGITIPVSVLEIFSSCLSGGRLAHGEKRTIKITLGGETFDVKLSSSNFNRDDYPNHGEQWQILYPKTGALAVKIRDTFSAGQKFFTLRATEREDSFSLEPNCAVDEMTLERFLDLSTLTDLQATLIERFGLQRLRSLNRKIGEELKRNYNFRCQICGRSVGEFYGVDLAECHHIAPFSESLNNDADNLLIVCPNHHRIIHAAKPTFDRERKLYLYPNGAKEILRLNEHL